MKQTRVLRKIFKYELEITDIQEVYIPSDHKILSVNFQSGRLCLWALVDPSSFPFSVTVEIFGTGHPVPDPIGFDREYIGTALNSRLVWHVFYRTNETVNEMSGQ